MRFSLIVATIGRRDELTNLLESLLGSRGCEFEVIIVDQNPRGFIGDIVERYSTQMNLIHLRSDRPGASRARNVGIPYARGEIVAFPDDDCELSGDLLGMVSDIFRRSPDLAGLTISSRDKGSEGSIARFAGHRGPITKFNILNRCIEAGIFLRRQSLNGHRFDESMGVGADSPWWSDEGPDLLLAVMRDGQRLEFVPEIVIFHPDPVRDYDERALLRSFRYGRGRGHFLRKNAYPAWFVIYVWGLYVIGIFLGVIELRWGKVRYYSCGLKGRVMGFFDA